MIGASPSTRTLRCRSALGAARRVIGATPCRAAAVLALVAPGAALAAGNTLTMTGATFDSTSPAPGSTEALSGGYGVSQPGACYTTANTPYEPPQTGVSKEVWVKANTTAPASPEMIFGDQFLWIAEDTAGFLVVGSGPYFSHDASLYINPSNNSFISSETPVTTPGYQLYQNRALTDGQWHHIVVSVEPSLGPAGAHRVLQRQLQDGRSIYRAELCPFLRPSRSHADIHDRCCPVDVDRHWWRCACHLQRRGADPVLGRNRRSGLLQWRKWGHCHSDSGFCRIRKWSDRALAPCWKRRGFVDLDLQRAATLLAAAFTALSDTADAGQRVPARTMSAPATIGRACSLVLLVQGIRIDLRDVTSFRVQREDKRYFASPYNSDPVEIVVPQGWRGSFEVARADSAVDDLFVEIERAYRIAGNVSPTCTIYQYVMEPDDNLSTYEFSGVSLTFPDAGQYAADSIVQTACGLLRLGSRQPLMAGEVYRIGVAIALQSNSSQVLGALGKELLGIHLKAKDLEGGLSRIKIAAIGLGGVFAGSAVLGGMAKLVEHGKEFVHQQSLMAQAGVGQKDIAEATGAAWANASKILNAGASDNLKLIADLRNEFGRMDEAVKASSAFTKLGVVTAATTGGDPERAGYTASRFLGFAGLAGRPPRTGRDQRCACGATGEPGRGDFRGHAFACWAGRAAELPKAGAWRGLLTCPTRGSTNDRAG